MHFLSGFSNVATVTFTLYLLSHGINQTQIGFLFGFFMVCMAIFNIPTGVIADMFGHKASVVIALLLDAVYVSYVFFIPQLSWFFSWYVCLCPW